MLTGDAYKGNAVRESGGNAGQQIGGTWTASLKQPATIAFTHYAKADKQLVLKEGVYNPYENVRAVDAAWNELGKTYYRFAPSNTPDTWCSDLAGWVIVPDYEESATVKAKMQFAQETGYCVGSSCTIGCELSLWTDYVCGAGGCGWYVPSEYPCEDG